MKGKRLKELKRFELKRKSDKRKPRKLLMS
jgi:hypothetical protein